MGVVNKAAFGLDFPMFEQLADNPVQNSAAGNSFDDDESRYIYSLFTTTNFWRFDTWNNMWQQLASAPAGTMGAGTCMRYVSHVGSQVNGVVYGSLYALIANAVAPVWYKYDIGTNTWSSALSIANLPATVGTDSSISFINTSKNNYADPGASQAFQITCNAAAIVGATTVSCTALSQALPVGAVLNFGSTSAKKYAVLTVAATVSATSLTVAPLLTALVGTEIALWSGQAYLVTNASTQIYRYDIASNAWSTTNVAAAAIPVLPGGVSTGCAIRWLPGFSTTRLYILRGGGTASIYYYDLALNTTNSVTQIPQTETFTTGSCVTTRSDATGRPYAMIIQKDATNRYYTFNPSKLSLDAAGYNFLAPSTAVVGDKLCLIRTVDGIDVLYHILPSRTWMTRAVLPTQDF